MRKQMSNIPSVTIEIKHGVHRRGERYPEHDFEYVVKYGVTSKGNAIACSNLDIKEQIDRAYEKSPGASEVHYFYYEEDKTPL